MAGDGAKRASLTVFALAMAFAEAAVVVYLRKIYYPQGFCFPLAPVSAGIISVEILRETATIFMIAFVAYIAGNKFYIRLAYFLFVFGLWDIFYYIFLKALLGWPSSFLTWDILFLIPVAWLAPVLPPIICSLTMILMSMLILRAERSPRLNFREWALVISGAAAIFITFIFDVSGIVISGGFLRSYFSLPANEDFISAISSFVPSSYNWSLFAAGEALILAGLFLFYRKIKSYIATSEEIPQKIQG